MSVTAFLRAVLPIAALLFGGSAALGQTVQPATLGPGEMLSGRFVQERHLKDFAQPLRSEGRFLLAPGKGLIWQTEKPFPSTTAITITGLVQLSGGKEMMRIPVAKVPFISQLYTMLGGALSGDWSVLEERFVVDRGAGPGDAWKVVLTPRDTKDVLATQMESISAIGRRLVEETDIRRSSGDYDHLVFSDQKIQRDPPSAADAALLNGNTP